MNKAKVVYLFPGQGAQYPGMGMDFIVSGSVKSLFDTASEILGRDVKELLQADAETLKRTDISQPMITLANLAAALYLGEQGYNPVVCAGFSLGEYAALVSAGIINAADCLRLVKARGEAMQAAADRLREKSADPSAAPGMAAIMGLTPEKIEDLISQWSAAGLKDLYAANINSNKQVVISGTAEALTEAEARFKEAGAKRIVRLQVAGPFHSPLMAEAANAFSPVLNAVKFSDPAIAIYSNVTGNRITSGEDAKKLALQQITAPVRWVDEQFSIAGSAASNGAGACLEVGPGKVLQGLWKDSESGLPCYPAGTVEEIGALEDQK